MAFACTFSDDIPFELEYTGALNRLLHATNFELGFARWTGAKHFAHAEEHIVLTYVNVRTDKRSVARVSLTGIANCFLGEVIPAFNTAVEGDART